MKSMNLKNLAAVSAVALTIGLYANTASSAPFEMDGSTPFTANVTAAVDNTADLAVTDIDFGTLGATSDAVDTAEIVLDPSSSAITDDIGAGLGGAGEAHLVSQTNSGTPGVATFAGLNNTLVFAYYSNLVDMDCALCTGGNPNLRLEKISDNMAVPGSYTKTGAVSVTGIETTTAGGALIWEIGATIQTLATAAQYETGAYAGTFDIMLTY